jgi:hypothetical protein
MCAPKIPKPDPLIGQAAKSNSDIAADQLALGKEQLAWERERAEKQDPLVQKIVDQQMRIGDSNEDRASAQWDIYQDLFHPVEQKMVEDANSFDSEERKSRMAAEAGADVTRSYDGALASNQRGMERMGINPNSGRFQGLNNEMNLSRAKDMAGGMNLARRNTELSGMAMREGVAKFGRNMTSTGLAADSAALNGGNAATGTMAQSAAIRNSSMAGAQNWFGGATNSNSSAANIGLGLFQGEMQGAQAKAEASAGLGQLIGTLGVGAMSM